MGLISQNFSTHDDSVYTQRFKQPLRQLQSLNGRALLRGLLACMFPDVENWQLIFPSGSQPAPPYAVCLATGRQVYVSITHSHERVAVACSKYAPIGIDLERIRPRRNMLAILAECCQESDYHRLPVSMLQQYRLWTLHEAVCKVDGGGLRFPMLAALLELDLCDKPVSICGRDIALCLRSQVLDAYALAIVCGNGAAIWDEPAKGIKIS